MAKSRLPDWEIARVLACSADLQAGAHRSRTGRSLTAAATPVAAAAGC